MTAGLHGDDLGTPYLRFDRHGPLAWCMVDRPEARNAMTPAMYFGLRRAVDLVNRDDALAALIITGTGDVFIPGGELRGREPDRWLDFPDLLGLDATPFEAIALAQAGRVRGQRPRPGRRPADRDAVRRGRGGR